MSILNKFFKKEESSGDNEDILKEIRINIAGRASNDLYVLRSSAEKEAASMIEWCKIAEKKNDPADYIDVAIVLMSYSAASSFAIMQEIKKLLKSQACVFEENLFKALGKIDVLYDESDHIKDLKSKRAEVYYLLGKKPSFRIKKAAQLLAVRIVSSENLQAARLLYKNGNYSIEIGKQLDEEMKIYDDKIVKEIIN